MPMNENNNDKTSIVETNKGYRCIATSIPSLDIRSQGRCEFITFSPSSASSSSASSSSLPLPSPMPLSSPPQPPQAPCSSALTNFSDDVGSLWSYPHRTVPVLDRPPSPLSFLRDYVSVSRPCIIRNAILVNSDDDDEDDDDYDRGGVAIRKKHDRYKQRGKPLCLTLDDLIDLLDGKRQRCDDDNNIEGGDWGRRKSEERGRRRSKDTEIESTYKNNNTAAAEVEAEANSTLLTVDVTPDGRGDCIRTATYVSHKSKKRKKKKMFVKPEERVMSITDFRDALRGWTKHGNRSKVNKEEEEEEKEYQAGLDAEAVVDNDHDDHENGNDDNDNDEMIGWAEKDEDGLVTLPLLGSKSMENDNRDRTQTSKKNRDTRLLDDDDDDDDDDEENVNRKSNDETKEAKNCNNLANNKITTRPKSMTTNRTKHHIPPVVPYYSRQNDCLRTELSLLFNAHPNLFPRTFSWAQNAFGTGLPDAINLWIGNERAVSGTHKDHYENLFYVCSGQKIFTLCPPADAPFLHEGVFESGRFRCFDGLDGKRRQRWEVVPDGYNKDLVDGGGISGDNGGGGGSNGNGNDAKRRNEVEKVKWIEPDIDRLISQSHGACNVDGNGNVKEEDDLDAYLKRFPLLRYAHPMRVTVSQGDMLYLPALWFHRVTQTCETVGMNYWFDMRFDSPAWCYFNFVQNVQVR